MMTKSILIAKLWVIENSNKIEITLRVPKVKFKKNLGEEGERFLQMKTSKMVVPG